MGIYDKYELYTAEKDFTLAGSDFVKNEVFIEHGAGVMCGDVGLDVFYWPNAKKILMVADKRLVKK